MSRSLCVLVWLLGTGLLLARAADAHAATPGPAALTVTVGERSVSIAGAEALPAGPTRVVIETRGPEEVEGLIVSLVPGKTLEDLRAALPRAATDPASLQEVVVFEAGGVPTRRRPYATTIDVRAGVTYLVASVSADLADTRFAVFAAAAPPTGATMPSPGTTVGLYDYAFAMPATLPRRGTVRFENPSDHLHMAVAFAVRRGKSRVAATQALLRGRLTRFGRLVDRRYTVLATVSPGTVNDVEVRFPRRGDYVFACFVEDGERGDPVHTELGMAKAFRVR